MTTTDKLSDELYEAGRALINVVGTVGASGETWDAIKRLRTVTEAHRRASQAAPAPSDGLREAVPAGLVEALRSGRQADMDGVMVTVSRQACEMAADILSALTPAPAQEPEA